MGSGRCCVASLSLSKEDFHCVLPAITKYFFHFFCFASNSRLLELTAAICNHQHHSAKSVGWQVVRAFLLPVKEERPGGVVSSELFTQLQLIWSELDQWLESGWLALKRVSMQDYPCPCIFVCSPCEVLWGRDYGFP